MPMAFLQSKNEEIQKSPPKSLFGQTTSPQRGRVNPGREPRGLGAEPQVGAGRSPRPRRSRPPGRAPCGASTRPEASAAGRITHATSIRLKAGHKFTYEPYYYLQPKTCHAKCHVYSQKGNFL